MSQESFERGDWQAVIDAHPLESHDPAEWLRYGAALEFVQAQKEGASALEVRELQRQVVVRQLNAALRLVLATTP
jgi:hypothetical protein